ncbi:serine/threonine-protein kinase [Streptomyces caeruleatus]|uniref:Serine/threonine protein kinase n=1 Tax=Streptomyces caeruleatus TaxID=661399 RepID=A0A101TKP3_9ACTN|nr:serine/threonine-protein kinase [Streptomyces caeruleatus]KUN94116.1 serine/threonine protein kinase [Streptomyces caeruleatus]
MEQLGSGDPLGVPPGVQHWGKIGAYRLLARLGAGGMGDVYLARSDRGRTVAVKLVRRELAAQEEFRARFRQEVQAARQVGGFWTAPVLDADTEADVPWVATGYVAGPSLQQVVGRDHGALPERSVRILAAGLAHALKDIHAAGIVHRDLKPSNVLVTIDGPRVIDFGIARALETVDETGLTRTGALVGSPGFMAPEQVRGDRITPACDVFCLGSVLAYAATGTLPFGSVDSGAHAVMFRIAQEEPDLEGVPEGIADLVRDCLRKDPGARPTLDRILERTGAEDTVYGGRSRDPWLPSALVAQLGRHAVRLLDTEDPAGPAGPAGPAAGAGEAQAPARDGGPGAPGSGGVPGAAEPTPAASPEHAPAAPPTPPDQLPTMAAPHTGPTPPPPGTPPVGPFGEAAAPGRTPAHPAYGSPQQHPQQHAQQPQQPQQPGYGYPQAGPYPPQGPTPTYGPTPPYNPTPPYGPPLPYLPAPPPEEPRRSGRSTVALVLVALVVALAAGGSVYALMNGGGDDGANGNPTAGPTTATSGPTDQATSPTPDPTDSAPTDGAIPTRYLGTWTASIDNATGQNSRRLTIRQGEVGDTVLTLVADGPAGTGTYHCEFTAALTEAPGTDGPLKIGPSTVTTGEPATSCSPGEATEITLLPDGRLERLNTSSGEKLTYTRQ